MSSAVNDFSNFMINTVTAPWKFAGESLGIIKNKKEDSTTPVADALSKMSSSSSRNIKKEDEFNNVTNYVRYLYSKNTSNFLGSNFLGI